jgi:hypothetical protein
VPKGRSHRPGRSGQKSLCVAPFGAPCCASISPGRHRKERGVTSHLQIGPLSLFGRIGAERPIHSDSNDFHEKASFVKPTVAPLTVQEEP